PHSPAGAARGRSVVYGFPGRPAADRLSGSLRSLRLAREATVVGLEPVWNLDRESKGVPAWGRAQPRWTKMPCSLSHSSIASACSARKLATTKLGPTEDGPTEQIRLAISHSQNATATGCARSPRR